MKIKETWKAIQSYFKMDPSNLEAQELTVERVQQLNDELGNVMTRNQELETLLADEQQSHADTKQLFWHFSRKMPHSRSLPLKMQTRLKAAPKNRCMLTTKSQMISAHNF